MKIIDFFRQRLYLIAGIVVLLAYLIDWGSNQSTLRGFLPPSSQPTDIMDSYLINVSSLHFDKAGQLHYSLDAARIEHSLVSAQTLLAQPVIGYFSMNPPWHVSANEGSISEDGDRIELSKNVVLLHQDSQSKLMTQHLVIRPDDKFAESDTDVILQSSNGETRATGMKAWLDRDLYLLQSNVIGQYEKHPPQIR